MRPRRKERNPALPDGATRPATRSSVLRRLGAVLATALMLSTFLVTGGGTAYAANPDTHRVATWNMQVGSDRWQGVRVLARDNSVVALQEVPNTQPAGSIYMGRINGIDEYRWDIGRGDWRYLYVLGMDSRNVGIVTSFRPERVVQIRGQYRNALGVVRQADDVLFASLHAASGGGFDVPQLLSNTARDATYYGVRNWAALGDFNRDPSTLPPFRLPPGSYVYNTGLATHQGGSELDYMVSNVNTDNWQATRGINRGSDHWPVHFGSLRAQAEPRERTMHAQNSRRNIDVFNGNDSDGTHVIQYHDNGAVNQRWRLVPGGYTAPDGDPLYRIVSSDSGKCLDVNRGQSSSRGDYLNIWTCHGREGQPDPGGPQRDTQNWTLEHPVPTRPNLTMLRNNSTGLYANINGGENGDGAWVVQWPDQIGPVPISNETFYLHPTVAAD